MSLIDIIISVLVGGAIISAFVMVMLVIVMACVAIIRDLRR